MENTQIPGNVFRDTIFRSDVDGKGQVMSTLNEDFTMVGRNDNQFGLTRSSSGQTPHLVTNFSDRGKTVEVKDDYFRGRDFPRRGGGDSPAKLLVMDNNTVKSQGSTLMDLNRAETLVLTGNRLEGTDQEASVSIGDSIGTGVVSGNVLLNAEIDGIGNGIDSFDNVNF